MRINYAVTMDNPPHELKDSMYVVLLLILVCRALVL